MKQELKVEAFVLAGGKSSRMGQDKGMISLNGRPMVSYALEVLEEVGLPVKIIANEEDYKSFGYPVFPDIVKEKGPMGGLLTAFENTEAEMVLLISCDMPLITAEAVKELLSKLEKEEIVAPIIEQRINPLFALYPLHLKQEVEERIAAGQLKMTDFILNNEHTLVPSLSFRNPASFRNVNTQQELKEVEEKWQNLK